MLQYEQRVIWEKAEQDEPRSFHLCNVLSKTPIPEGVKKNYPQEQDMQIKERPE